MDSLRRKSAPPGRDGFRSRWASLSGEGPLMPAIWGLVASSRQNSCLGGRPGRVRGRRQILRTPLAGSVSRGTATQAFNLLEGRAAAHWQTARSALRQSAPFARF
jgi:hypothetical protein